MIAALVTVIVTMRPPKKGELGWTVLAMGALDCGYKIAITP